MGKANVQSTLALSARSNMGASKLPVGASHQNDFTSDVGRKRFGFSHEEIDESSAYYEGQFKLSLRCGEGTLHSPDLGCKYVGQFLNDRIHGVGEQIFGDGSRYKGQWRHGQKHGNAEYTSHDGLKYVGQWENGRRHGQGMQEYANADRYEGMWYRGMCSGPGTYIFADGSRYEGVWANGRYDGAGMSYGNDGSRERQWYSNGLLTKREVLPSGPVPKGMSASRKAMATAGVKALLGQTRTEVQKPVVLPEAQASKYLITRETAHYDLSAPPLKPKTAPARVCAAAFDGTDAEAPAPSPPRTAPARVGAESSGL